MNHGRKVAHRRGSSPGRSLSLNKCVRLAVEQNPVLQAAQTERSIQQLEKPLAVSAFLPTLDVEGSFSAFPRTACNEWVATPERLSELDIYTPKGTVPLQTLAAVERAQSQTVISRENLENTIDLTGYNRTVRISQVLTEIDERTRQVAFPGGYGMRMSGTAAEMQESMSRMMSAMVLGSMLLIVLLIGTFRSFLLPIPVLVAIPLPSSDRFGDCCCWASPCVCRP